MTNAQKQALKEKMQAEYQRIGQDIDALEELTRPVRAEDMDEIARMDAIVSKSVNSAALFALRGRLAGLEYALKRIGHPDFGYCAECGEVIPFARLQAMPETTLCVECAQ